MTGLKDFSIDFSGLDLIKRLLLSSPGCEFNYEILRNSDDMTLAQLRELAELPAITLFAYAKKAYEEPARLGREDVMLAYSGEIHARDTAIWIRDPRFIAEMEEQGFILKNYWKKIAYAFLHIVIPVRVIELPQDDIVDGVYEGKVGAIDVGKIFVPNIFQLQKGQIIFVHSGSVVSGELSRPFYLSVMGYQKRINWMSEAMQGIDKIDCRSDFGRSLTDWSRESWRKYCALPLT